jgi:CheY-like chemotaxis protein
MEKDDSHPIVLMADDDPDDYHLVRVALKKSGIRVDLRRAKDGEELMNYLLRQKEFVETKDAFRPRLILLDLNMPLKNGWEALSEIKENPAVSGIPVVIFSSSNDPQDVSACHHLGADGYISKPATFESLMDTVHLLADYWLKDASPALKEIPASPENQDTGDQNRVPWFVFSPKSPGRGLS